MRVLVKNVSIEKQFPNAKNLSTCNERDLHKVALAYQIGTHKQVKVEREVNSRGERITTTAFKREPRGRVELVNAVRERSKVVIDLPRDYWSDEQYETFLNEGLLETMDVNAEVEGKKRLGVYKEIIPFEDLPRHKQDEMFMDLSLEALDYVIREFNYTNERDKNGLFVNRWRPLLYPHEFLSEDKNEEEIAKEMTKLVQTGNAQLANLEKALNLVSTFTE